MTKRKVKAAAIYCRISEDKAGEGLGVQRQEDLGRELAQTKSWPVAEVYVDNDISAYSGKRRPSYESMLADLEAGHRDAVVCVDLDRLTRHPAELESFITLADAHGIALANVSGDTDLASSDGRFKARILGAVARQESERKSERIKRQREQAARHGVPMGRHPFGFEDDGITHRPNEASIIWEAARRLLAGESLHAIAYDFAERGVVGRQTGKPMASAALRHILTNPRIAGLRRHRPRDRNGRVEDESIFEAKWEPIIDRATFERLQARIRRNGNGNGGRGGRPAAHLLSGLLKCGVCGAPMYASSRGVKERKVRRYVCLKRPGRPGCGRVVVTADPVDVLVFEMAVAALVSPKLAKALKSAATKDDESGKLADELAGAEERLEAVAVDFADGRIGRREWLAARDRLNERIGAIRATLERSSRSGVISTLPATENALRAAWEAGSLDWRRALLRALFEAVIVNPAPRPGRFDPSRIEPVWRA